MFIQDINDTKMKMLDKQVIISAHSPPGFFERYPVLPFFNSTYNDAYVALMAQHCDTIHSHVYGHLHTDSFRLFGGNDGEIS